MKEPLFPPPLKRGDCLALIAPAGPLRQPEMFTAGVNILREMGFLVKFPRDLWPGRDYLADSDENRAAEFNRLLRDPEVKALLAVRGGYGSLRLLAKIDPAPLLSQPKLLIGFSDITILLNALFARIGLISLHGPTLTSLAGLSREAGQRFYRSLTTGRCDEISDRQIEILRPGATVRAPLLGGNLASLLTLLGTPWDFPWTNAILLLEETNEPPYKVDRMLTQLLLAGKFAGLKGLLLGDFSLPGEMDQMDQMDQMAIHRYQESVWHRTLEVVAEYPFPVWARLPCGHCRHNLTVPIGADVVMDGKGTRLLFPR